MQSFIGGGESSIVHGLACTWQLKKEIDILQLTVILMHSMKITVNDHPIYSKKLTH